jgi:polyphosphate kinase 2 (PPK2 family)
MLEKLDLTKKLSKTAYGARLKVLQNRLRLLQYAIQEADAPLVVCVEGWNACGRGEIIKKLTELLDPRLYQVNRGRPPTPLEQRYHFLCRYEVALPRKGEMVVFDHSWYSRVLEDRCDRIVKKKVWRLAYTQINELEHWLVDDGTLLVKLWLHISRKEQRRRYRVYEKDPLLRWKLTKDYSRQQKHYGRWTKAVEEMLERCNTAYAPWTLVEAEDPRWARISVLDTVVLRLEQVLNLPKPRPVRRRAARAHAQKAGPQAANKTTPAPKVEEKRTEAADAVEQK